MGTAFADFKGRADAEDSESAGKVALRYSAGSNLDSKNGASAGSATCEDLETVFSSATAMMSYGDMNSCGDVPGSPKFRASRSGRSLPRLR